MKTRSKDFANILANLNLSIDYEKVLGIETDIANTVVQRALKNNGVYVPPSIQAGLPVYFAVDNYDFKSYTADGKNEFDGTAQFVYQQSSAIVVSEKVLIDHNQNTSFHCDPFPVSQVCPKPKPKTEIYPQFTPKNKDIDLYKKWDCIWFLTKTLKRENSTNVIPTWAAYDSLITNVLPVTIYCGVQLYPSPTTD